MADDLAVLGLSVDSSAAIRGVQNFTRETGGMMSAVKQATVALASLFASAKAVQFIGQTSAEFARFGDQMSKMSQRLDISAQKLTELSYIASQSGTSIETFENGVRLLQRNLNSADEEAKSATAAFEKLGVSLIEIRQQSPDEQFKTVAEAIASLSSPTERTAATMKIFGRSGTELLPFLQLGRTGMDKLAEKARNLGIVMENGDYDAAVNLTDAMDTLTRSVGAVRNALVSGLTPELTSASETIAQTAGDVVKFIREHEVLVKTIMKLTVAIAAITAVYGAYKILQTTLLAQRAMRAALAAQQARNIAQTTAETAALTANTAAQVANNAAKGAGVATGGAKAATGLLGGTGGTVFAIAAFTAGALSLVQDGYEQAEKAGKSTVDKIEAGFKNLATAGLSTLPARWKEAGQGVDSGLERTKLLANTFTLGISGATEKIAEMLGVTSSIRDILLSMPVIGAQDEVERGKQYDEELAQSNAYYDRQDRIKNLITEGREDFREGEEFAETEKGFQSRRDKLRLRGVDAAQYDANAAEERMNEAASAYRRWERDYKRAEDKAQNAFDSMTAAEEELIKINQSTAGDYSKEADQLRNRAKQAADDALKAYEDAQKEVESLSGNAYKDVAETRLKAEEEYMSARQNYASAFNAEEAKKRESRYAEQDAAINMRFTGLQSSESRAGKAQAESENISARLEEMKQAASKVDELTAQMKSTTDLKEVAELQQQIDYYTEIAGEQKDRLDLENQIVEKQQEEAEALKSVAEREEEVLRAREEREKAFTERAAKMAEDYANKWMTEQEKVQVNQNKMRNAQAEAETFAYREQAIRDMDAQIAALGETAKQGGDSGREAEQAMNDLIKERSRAEEELAKDKSQNLEDQYAALNAIDTIAGEKANEYANEYQKQMDKWNEGEKSERKAVSSQKAIDAASAEGFAQMSKIYDTSQKKIEDHTKNIKEYTRQMKQYLMQLAAQGDSTWALDVEGA